MLSSDHYPQLPRAQLLAQHLPPAGQTSKAHIAVLMCLLAQPLVSRTFEELVDLLEYSPARLRTVINRLTTVPNTKLRAQGTAGSRMEFYLHNAGELLWPPTRHLFGDAYVAALGDQNLVAAMITDIRRRARVKRGNTHQQQVQQVQQQLQQTVPPSDAVTINQVDTATADGNTGLPQPYRTPSPQERSVVGGTVAPRNAQCATSSAATSANGLHMETEALVNRFKDITQYFQQTLTVKKQMEEAGQAGFITQSGLLQEPHDELQAMLDETGHIMADAMGTKWLPIISPCTICFDAMRRPRVFPNCGHAFCTNCISRLPILMSGMDYVGQECPLCRVVSHPVQLYL